MESSHSDSGGTGPPARALSKNSAATSHRPKESSANIETIVLSSDDDGPAIDTTMPRLPKAVRQKRKIVTQLVEDDDDEVILVEESPVGARGAPARPSQAKKLKRKVLSSSHFGEH